MPRLLLLLWELLRALKQDWWAWSPFLFLGLIPRSYGQALADLILRLTDFNIMQLDINWLAISGFVAAAAMGLRLAATKINLLRLKILPNEHHHQFNDMMNTDCALVEVENIGFEDYENCLVKIEELRDGNDELLASCAHRPLKTFNQIVENRDDGGFSLRGGETKRVPIAQIYSEQHGRIGFDLLTYPKMMRLKEGEVYSIKITTFGGGHRVSKRCLLSTKCGKLYLKKAPISISLFRWKFKICEREVA